MAAAPKAEAINFFFFGFQTTDWGYSPNWDGAAPTYPGSLTDHRIYFRPAQLNVYAVRDITCNMNQSIALVHTLQSDYSKLTLTGGRIVVGSLVAATTAGNTISNEIFLDKAVDFNITGSLTVTGTINATQGALIKKGGGILTLSGQNDLQSGLQVTAGTVKANHEGALGGAPIYFQGGNIDLNGYNAAVGNLFFGDGSTATTGNFTGAGALEVNGGITFFGNAAHTTNNVRILQNLVLSDGIHGVGMGQKSNSSLYDFLFSGNVSGAGGFLFDSPNMVAAMTGTNTYAGATTVRANTVLGAASAGALPTNTALTVDGTLTFQVGVTQAGLTAGTFSQTVGSLAGASTGSIIMGSGSLTVKGLADTNYAGSITGSGSLTKNGAGTLTLSGTNSYTGGTTVGGGRLIVAHPIGHYLANNGWLEFRTGSGDEVYSNQISGTSAFVKSGPGVLLLTGANFYNGGTVVNEGTLVPSNAAALGSIGGSLDTGSNGTLALASYDAEFRGISGSGKISLAAGRTLFTTATFNSEFSGIISGAGGISKPGSGTLTLSGKNTYTGGTVVGAGKLILSDPTGNYLANGNMEVKRDDVLNPAVLSGTVTGSGNFVKSGAGALFVTGSLNNTGTVTVSEGMLNVLKLDRNYINNAGLTVYGATSTQTGVVSGTGFLRKNLFQDLTLTGTNTYTGGTYIYGGRIITSSNGSLGAPAPIYLDAAFATSLISNGYNVTATTLTGTGTLSINGATLTIGDDSNFQYNGSVLGNSSTQLVKKGTGTATLTGNTTYSGLTTVQAGRLVVPKPAGNYDLTGALEFALTGDQSLNALVTGIGSVTVSGSGTLTAFNNSLYSGGTTINAGAGLLAYSPNGNYLNNGHMEVHNDLASTFSGVISGTGSLTKTGDQMFFVTGNNTFTGGTTVQFGTLAAASVGSLANGNLTVLRGTVIPVVENVGLNNLTLGDGATTNVGGLFGSFSFALNGGITYNFAPGGGAITTASRLNLVAGQHTVTDNGNHSNQIYDAVISRSIGGAGGITKTGGHSLILTAANSYTGGTIVSNGTLYLGAVGALPTTGVLTVNSGATASLSPILWSSGVQGGEFSQTVGSIAGTGNILLGSASLTVDNSANATWDGIISGTGSLIKKGAGNLLLNTANAYTGGTIVEAGKLIVKQPTGTSYDDRSRIEFNVPSGNITSFAGTIFGSGGVDKTGVGPLTLSGVNTYTGGTNVLGGRLIVTNPNGNYNVANNAFLEFNNGLDTISSGVLTGSGTITKLGLGTTTLTGDSLFLGRIRSAAGTLAANSPNAFGGANVLLVGGNLGINASNVSVASLTFGEENSNNIGSISGPGSIDLAFGLTLNLMTANRTSPVSIGSAIILGDGDHTLADNGQRSSGAYDAVFSGAISGPGSLTKTGNGIIAMTGANSYMGVTNVNGKIFAGATNTLSANSAFTIGEGSTLSLNPITSGPGVVPGNYSQRIGSLSGVGQILLGSAALTFGDAAQTVYYGNISGTGSLVKTGAGRFILVNGQNYTGGTTIEAGTFSTDDPIGDYVNNGVLESAAETFAGKISGTGSFLKVAGNETTLTGINTYSGGTTILSGQLTVLHPVGNYANSGILQFSNGTASGVISGAGTLFKSGTGTVTLSGINTYTGGTTIDAGRLIVTNPVGNYTDRGVLEVQNSGALSFDGRKVTGVGGFAKSGAGVMTMAQKLANTGGIEIKEGTLKGTTSVFVGKAIVGDAGATLQLETTGTSFFTADYSGAGNLLKTGSGRLLLDGPLSHTGGTTVGQGAIYAVSAAELNGLNISSGALFLNDAQDTVTVNGRVITQGEFDTTDGSTTVFKGLVSGAGNFGGFGEVHFDGGYSPGNSPTAATIQGDMFLGTSNDLTMELGGTTLGSGYDHLNVGGTAFLDGTLNVAWYGGFTASLGQSFDLFDFALSSGNFAAINLPTLGNGLKWNSSMLYTDGKLSVQAVPEPASIAALGLGALVVLRRRKK